MQASVPVVDWVYQLSAACLDTLSPRPPPAMRTSITTRFDAHRKRLLDELRPRSKAKGLLQLGRLPKDELDKRSSYAPALRHAPFNVRFRGYSGQWPDAPPSPLLNQSRHSPHPIRFVIEPRIRRPKVTTP